MDFNKDNLRIETVRRNIKDACVRCGRNPDEVTLMAVSKTRTPEEVAHVLDAGVALLGENRVQEGMEKRRVLSGRGSWELIGPLQRNKARMAVDTFDRIQTVDRLSLVTKLDQILRELERPAYPVLLQVNVDGDPAKSGCLEGEVHALMEAILESRQLQLDGLMTIGEFTDDESVQRRTFSGLRELRDRLREQFGVALQVLSMGMSADMAVAIEEGSTLVRVGTALFGARE